MAVFLRVAYPPILLNYLFIPNASLFMNRPSVIGLSYHIMRKKIRPIVFKIINKLPPQLRMYSYGLTLFYYSLKDLKHLGMFQCISALCPMFVGLIDEWP